MQAIQKSKPRERLLFTLLTETGLQKRDPSASAYGRDGAGEQWRGCWHSAPATRPSQLADHPVLCRTVRSSGVQLRQYFNRPA